MRLTKHLNEDIDKIFIRIGSMSGQKQTHRKKKPAPARKGIWMLPIQSGKQDLAFLGGFIGKVKRFKTEPKDFEKEYGMSLDDFVELPFQEMDKIENAVLNRKIKKLYKSVKLKNTDYVWTHMGKGPPDIDNDDDWPWYKVSVNEYWKLFKKTFGGDIKKGYSFDGEWAEVFWETT